MTHCAEILGSEVIKISSFTATTYNLKAKTQKKTKQEAKK